MRAFWGLQHCGHEWDSGLPEKAVGPPVTWVSPGEIEVVGDGFPRVLGTSTGTVTGSDRRCRWLSWEPWRGWLSCSRLWAGGNLGGEPVPASARSRGGDRNTRPSRRPFAEDTVGGHSTTEKHRMHLLLKNCLCSFVFLVEAYQVLSQNALK